MMAQTPASIQQASWGPSGRLTQFCSSAKWRQTLLAEVTPEELGAAHWCKGGVHLGLQLGLRSLCCRSPAGDFGTGTRTLGATEHPGEDEVCSRGLGPPWEG